MCEKHKTLTLSKQLTSKIALSAVRCLCILYKAPVTSPATQHKAPISHNRLTRLVDTDAINKKVEHKQPYKAIASKSASYKASMHASQPA